MLKKLKGDAPATAAETHGTPGRAAASRGGIVDPGVAPVPPLGRDGHLAPGLLVFQHPARDSGLGKIPAPNPQPPAL